MAKMKQTNEEQVKQAPPAPDAGTEQQSPPAPDAPQEPVTFAGSGVAWDAQVDKVLCRFEKGAYTTDDPEKIKRLLALGYYII